MIDLETIKPGDRVVWSGESLHWPAMKNGAIVDVATRDGDVLQVADPATVFDSLGNRKVGIILPYGQRIYVVPKRLRCFDGEEEGVAGPSSCDCDLMMLMRRGCTCGALRRERERAAS